MAGSRVCAILMSASINLRPSSLSPTLLTRVYFCLFSHSTLTKTLKHVYGQHGVKKGLYRGLSLNYIRCVPSQAVAFTTYEFMKQVLHLN